MRTTAFLFSAALAVGLGPAGAASAAGSPPAASWTGYYVGLNAGYAFGASDSLRTGALSAACLSFGNPCAPGTLGDALTSGSLLGATGVWPVAADGFIGGAQIGHNWRISPSLVFGLETDIQGLATTSGDTRGATVSNAVATTIVTSISASKGLDWLGTARARFGFLVTPALMLYGTAGLAYGGAYSNSSILQAAVPPVFGATLWMSNGALSDTLVGWTAGAGGEWMFAPNWSAKLEYLYYDLGVASYDLGPLAIWQNPQGLLGFTNLARAATRFDGHVVRAGVNYHFDFAAPAAILN